MQTAEMQNFVRRIADCIHSHRLITEGDTVLVALSGGADSVALLRILLVLGVRCEAMHCNFRLRGEESERDERFVRLLCQQLNVPLHVISFDTRTYAREHRISIEMAARDLRYDYFAALRRQQSAASIAVAHHRDDNIETLLLNLIRGTGIHGLTAIRYRNGDIIRPLLDVSRQEILDYLGVLKQSYVTDSTNLEDDVHRNKLRLNVMPLLRELNPAVDNTLQQTISRMTDAALIYDEAIKEMKQRVQHGLVIRTKELRKETAPRTLLYELLKPYGFTSAQSAEVYEQLNGTSGRVYESNSWCLLRDRDKLLLRSKSENFTCYCPVLPLQGTVKVAPGMQFIIRRIDVGEGYEIKRSRQVLCADWEKLHFPLSLRTVVKGDRFCPFGMKGSKLVSDYLTDAKHSVFEKEHQLVVCSNTDIVWLVGERADNRFRIDNKTRVILQIDLLTDNDG